MNQYTQARGFLDESTTFTLLKQPSQLFALITDHVMANVPDPPYLYVCRRHVCSF